MNVMWEFVPWLRTMKSQKRGIGHENIEVALSFTTVRPGNWVYADEDGVLISETALS